MTGGRKEGRKKGKGKRKGEKDNQLTEKQTWLENSQGIC